MALASRPRALTREFDKCVDEVTQTVEDRIRLSITEGVGFLHSISPVFSGFYRRNHRVAVGSSNVDLEPSEARARVVQQEILEGIRDKGALDLDRDAKLREVVRTLKGFRLGQEITIGNAVSYSQEIEDKGTGTRPEGQFFNRTASAISNRLQERNR